MISKTELKQISERFNLNMGQSEKSFYQDLILFIIYRKYANDVVFKGGTALAKCYGFDRFSEDLDFTITVSPSKLKDNIEAGLKKFNVNYDIEPKKQNSSLNYKLLIEGPLYKPGNKRTLCSLKLDFSTREEILVHPNIIKIRPSVNLIPMFDAITMNKKEIFAEKIRTVFTRKQARDLYDLYYLDDSLASIELINKKLSYYNLFFSKEKYKEEITKIEKIWDLEMRHLINNYPDFNFVKKKLLSYFS